MSPDQNGTERHGPRYSGGTSAIVYNSRMQETIVVREWDPEKFHARVHELEAQGYEARHDTYEIKAEMNPETGAIIHLHTIELYKPER